MNRFELYDLDYLSQIEEYAKNEKKFLNEHLPEILLYTRIRMKSRPSYQKKINDRIRENKPFLIDDIIAERIIISEVNGSTDPKVLEEACYRVAEALEEYRKSTNFRLKDIEITGNSGKSDKSYITKDYIKNPKPSGYQSLHIITENQKNPDFSYETQIRSSFMEKAAKSDSKISHQNYKTRYFDDTSVLRVPRYIDVTNFKDEFGDPMVYRVPMQYAFHHYYGEMIETYREELSNLQKYVNLEDLKQKLKSVPLDLLPSFKNEITKTEKGR